MIQVLNNGNIISPKGASIIFGAESTKDHLDISVENESTYNEPYSIVIVEEDTDETLPAEQISYETMADSALTSNNVQGVIGELESLIYAVAPTLSQEAITLRKDQETVTLNNQYSSTSMLVFYNGLLINAGLHYSFTGTSILLNGFKAEADDILTVIGLSTTNSSLAHDPSLLIGGRY